MEQKTYFIDLCCLYCSLIQGFDSFIEILFEDHDFDKATCPYLITVYLNRLWLMETYNLHRI